MLTQKEVIFSIEKSVNKVNNSKTDFNLICQFKDRYTKWILYVWDCFPDLEEIDDIKNIVLKSFKFYHKNLEIPEYSVIDSTVVKDLISINDPPKKFQGWRVRREADGYILMYKRFGRMKKSLYIGKSWDEKQATKEIDKLLYELKPDPFQVPQQAEEVVKPPIHIKHDFKVGDKVRNKLKPDQNFNYPRTIGTIKQLYPFNCIVNFKTTNRDYPRSYDQIEKVEEELKISFPLDSKVIFDKPGYNITGKTGIVTFILDSNTCTVDFGENGGLVDCDVSMLKACPVYTHPTFKIGDEVLFNTPGYQITNQIGKITEQTSEDSFLIYFGEDIGYYDCKDKEFIKAPLFTTVPKNFQGWHVIYLGKHKYIYLTKHFEGKIKTIYIGKIWDEEKAIRRIKELGSPYTIFKKKKFIVVTNQNLRSYDLIGTMLSSYDGVYEIEFPDSVEVLEEKDFRKTIKSDLNLKRGDIVRLIKENKNGTLIGFKRDNEFIIELDGIRFVYNRKDFYKIMNGK
jgi:hypothetical protein